MALELSLNADNKLKDFVSMTTTATETN